MPLLPPASIAMLQMVMRSSMSSARDRVAGELHRLVERAVDADHADDVQDDVLAADTHGVELAVDVELDATTGTLNHASPVAMPTAASVEPTPVANAPSAP